MGLWEGYEFCGCSGPPPLHTVREKPDGGEGQPEEGPYIEGTVNPCKGPKQTSCLCPPRPLSQNLWAWASMWVLKVLPWRL